MKKIISIKLSFLLILLATSGFAQTEKQMADQNEVTIIQLSQSPGEFDTKELELAPGKYIFEVTNSSVEHKVAFLLIEDGKKPVADSGLPGLLKKGKTKKSGIVTLREGSYSYSCPLNPTPAYTLKVKKQ